MAYRNADFTRWQNMPFVVGIKVQLSNNHTLNGEPFVDICDHLKGDYPKDFEFVGWHPLCRCFATPILMTEEEFNADLKRRLKGQPSEPERSVNFVAKPPEGFNKWVIDHADRIASAKSLPYYIRQNQPFVKAALAPKDLTPLEIAAKRHAARTPEEAAAIQKAWDDRRERYRRIELAANNVLKVAKDYGEVDYSKLQSYIESGDLKRMRLATRSTAAEVLAMKKREEAISDLIPNAHKLHKSHSIKELQETHGELDGVMKNWLKKYNYSSLDNAPLDHLKNKLDFELNSTRKYTHSDIVKDALAEKIKLVDRQIEWGNMLSRVADLKAFKTKSSLFKGAVANIDDAIRRADFDALRAGITEAEKQQQRLFASQIKRSAGANTALNKEYKGGAIGRDITASVDTRTMKTTDSYEGELRYTNNVARMQGFDAPAKLVSEQEFKELVKVNGDIFFRTVNPTEFNGVNVSSKEFASQLYKADLLELNGKGGRYYGDGMYVTTSVWNGRNSVLLSDRSREFAYKSSVCYGGGQHTVLEMTWTRAPKIIKQTDLRTMWLRLTASQRSQYGNHENTFGCALGYDGMYCDSYSPYMVIWNRSIIAVKYR